MINLGPGLVSKSEFVQGLKSLARDFDRIEFLDEMIVIGNYDPTKIIGLLMERPIGMIYGIGDDAFLESIRSLGGNVTRPTLLNWNQGKNVLIVNEFGVDMKNLVRQITKQKSLMFGKCNEAVSHVFVHKNEETQFFNMLRLSMDNFA